MGPFEKALQYRQEGGEIAPVGAQTGIPTGGNAAQPISNYLSGTTPAPVGGAGGISYTPGAIAQGQQDRIAAQQNIRGLQDQGILNAPVAREMARQAGSAEAREFWKENAIAGKDAWTPEAFTGDLGLYENQLKVPGMSGVAANALGNYQIGLQRQKAADGGITLRGPDGQPVTVDKAGRITGNTGGVPHHVYFEAARKAGWSPAQDTISAKVGNMIPQSVKTALNVPVATQQSRDDDANVSRAQRTDAWSGMSAPRQASYESAVREHGFNTRGRNAGGMIYAQGGMMVPEDPWASRGVAMSRVKEAPIGVSSTPMGGGSAAPGVQQQLGALAAKTLTNKMLGGGFLGQAAGIVGGFNEGGKINIKKGNEGKFTAKAKAAGMGVQEYARKVLSDESASPATRRQANFARNAAAWHKNDGGMVGPLAKTTHTTAHGEKYEMNFHNPLQQKTESKGGE